MHSWQYEPGDILIITHKGVEQVARVAGYDDSLDNTTPLYVNLRVSGGLRWGERMVKVRPEQIRGEDREWYARQEATSQHSQDRAERDLRLHSHYTSTLWDEPQPELRSKRIRRMRPPETKIEYRCITVGDGDTFIFKHTLEKRGKQWVSSPYVPLVGGYVDRGEAKREVARLNAEAIAPADAAYAKMTPAEKQRIEEAEAKRRRRSPLDVMIDRACGLE